MNLTVGAQQDNSLPANVKRGKESRLLWTLRNVRCFIKSEHFNGWVDYCKITDTLISIVIGAQFPRDVPDVKPDPVVLKSATPSCNKSKDKVLAVFTRYMQNQNIKILILLCLKLRIETRFY